MNYWAICMPTDNSGRRPVKGTSCKRYDKRYVRLFLNIPANTWDGEGEIQKKQGNGKGRKWGTRRERRKTIRYVNVFAFYPCTLTREKLITIEWIATATSSLTRSKDRVACSFVSFGHAFVIDMFVIKNVYLYVQRVSIFNRTIYFLWK